MRVVVDGDRVRKLAETDAERSRLKAEARALRVCAHPGVVGLIATEGGDPPQELVLRALHGGSLAENSCQSLPMVIAWGAAIASTLADLHDIGWVHGSLSADHVLFDHDAKPVLCSFGRAEAHADHSLLAAAAAADVAALAALLLERTTAETDRRVVRFLSAAAHRSHRGLAISRFSVRTPLPGAGPRNTARQMSRRLIELVPDARLGEAAAAGQAEGLPSPVPLAAPIRPGGHRRWVVVAIAVLGLCAVLAAVGMAVAGLRPHRIGHPQGSLTLATSSRYTLTGPPEAQLLTVIGRWNCGPARPAVVDLRTGWVWVFDRWPPPGSAEPGRPVGHVRQPIGLAGRTSAKGCESLVALERSGRLEVLAVPAGP